MNLSLDNNVNKFVLLVVSGVVVLLVVNMNKKKLGNQLCSLISVLVILVSGFFGYKLLNQENEKFDVEYQSVPPADKYIEDFQDSRNPQVAVDSNSLNRWHEDAHKEDYPMEEPLMEEPPMEQVEEPPMYEAPPSDVLPEPLEVPVEQPVEGPVDDEFKYLANRDVMPGETNGVEQFSNYQSFKDNSSDNNTLNSEQLLPSVSQYSEINPSTNGDVNTNSLLNAGHHIGVNTTGCSLRNANRGLRSEPPNPQVTVSPWMQTTICPDLHRKTLDGGE